MARKTASGGNTRTARPVSKTRMRELVVGFRARDVAEALRDHPELLRVRDPRGRNALHLCCGTSVEKGRTAQASIQTADVLIEAGLDLDGEAFREGSWKATPLWYAVARGRNAALVRHLLERGASPEHCLWAATYHGDGRLLRTLIEAGATVDAVAEDETPLLHAAKWSRFAAAKVLLAAGADPDFRDRKKLTALHYLLKKGSDVAHVRMFVAAGARGDIPGPDGRTAIELLSRKRAPGFRALAAQLSER